MTRFILLAAVSAPALLFATPAAADVVYSSIPTNLATTPSLIPGNGWCSECGSGNGYQAVDQFTLSAATTITGFNVVAYNTGGYSATSTIAFQIMDSIHSSVLFSQTVTPTAVSSTLDPSHQLVNGALAPINLAAGTYYASFFGQFYAVPNFAGGNGSMVQVDPNNINSVQNVPGGNIGYELLGAGGGAVPEPAAWALMILGFGAVGAAQRRRKVNVAFA